MEDVVKDVSRFAQEVGLETAADVIEILESHVQSFSNEELTNKFIRGEGSKLRTSKIHKKGDLEHILSTTETVTDTQRLRTKFEHKM